MAEPESGGARRWQPWTIALLGAVLFGLTAANAAVSDLTAREIAFEATIPLGLSFAIVAFGAWLSRADLSDEGLTRVATWCVGSAVVLLGLGSWAFFLVTSAGLARRQAVFLPLTAVAFGGISGAVAGLYDARQRRHRRLADRGRALVEASTDVVSVLEPDGTVRYMSPSVEQVLGFAPDELVDENAFEYVHPDDREDAMETFATLIDDPDSRPTAQFRFEAADGSWVTIEARGRNLLDEPAVGGLVVYTRDVTDRVARERTLEALHGTTRELMDAATAEAICEEAVDAALDVLDMPITGCYLHDADEDVLRPAATTPAVSDLLDEPPTYSASDTVVWDVFESGEAVVIDDTREVSERLPDPETPVRSAILLPLGDHGVFITSSTEPQEFDGADRYFARLLAATTESALDRAERERELRRYETLVETASDAMYALDDDGYVTMVNEAQVELWGYDRETLLGSHVSTFMEPEQVDRGNELIAELLADDDRSVGRFEFETERPDGERRTYEDSVAVLTENGEFLGSVGVIRDVTERVEYQVRLAALNETSRGLMSADSPGRIAEITVETARQLLDYPVTAMWEYDADEDALVPLAASDSAVEFAADADSTGDLPRIEAGTAEMAVFRRGEREIVGAYDEVENPAHPETPLGSLLMMPLGEHGQLHVGSPEPDAFDDSDVELVEILGRTAQVALSRAEHERTLAAREERLRTIVENVPIVLFSFDDEGEITLSEGIGLEAVGFDPGELVGQSMYDVFEENPDIQRYVERSLSGEAASGTVEVGSRAFDVWYQPVFDGETVDRVIGVAVDVTERVEYVRRIADLHEATQSMIQADDEAEIGEIAVETARSVLDLPIATVWFLDDSGTRLEPAAATGEAGSVIGEMPTYDEGEGVSWQALEAGETRVFDDVRTAEATYNPDTAIRSEVVVPIGGYGVMNIGSTAVESFEESDVVLAELLAENASVAVDRVGHERELKRRNDQMEFFNSILRHDVLNAMTVIRARGELLAERLEGEEREYAETIVDWCDNAVEVIRRVRRVLEALTSEEERETEPVDLPGVIQRVVGRVRSTYPEVAFETDVPPGVTVEADELLSDVLGNVITNAVEHNEADGLRVEVGAEVDGRVARVRIADNGSGIEDDRKQAVFRRGETGHAKATGSGFGLFFVDSMVEEYGGDVWIEDNDAGGATFVVELQLGGQE